VTAVVLALTCTSAAFAQDAPAAATSPGPLVIERIHDGIVVAPDYKVTELDGDVAQLAGAYVGRVIDDTLLIGGAGYWLADGARGSDLKYGGVMIGWTTAPGRIRFGARGLVGGGSGTLPVTLGSRIAARFGGRTPPLVSIASVPAFRVREEFFVFEPQASAVAKVASHIAVDVAAGYRLVGMADGFGHRLDGVTGSLGLQFGW
jgi:hypothetical protein